MCDVSKSRWLSISLMLSSVHSVLWGGFIIVMPVTASCAYGFDRPPQEVFLWQGFGLVLLLYGIGYAIAALDPVRHWAVVLIGLLAKVLGPAGMLIAVVRGQVSSNVLWMLPVNDVIWWIPFSLIVAAGVRRERLRMTLTYGDDGSPAARESLFPEIPSEVDRS